jgi:hypothetical protein
MWLNFHTELWLSRYRITNQKSVQQPVVAGAEHASYLRMLAKLAIVGIILGVIFLMFWSAVTAPRFDENYVRSLLARHDPTIFPSERIGTGANSYDMISSDVFYEGGAFVERDAAISFTVEGNDSVVVSGEASWLGPNPKDVGPSNRSWLCPGGTWLNVSTQETDNYLYAGATGNFLSLLWWRDAATEVGWSSEDIANVAANLTANITTNITANQFQDAAIGKMYDSEVYYFSPDERAAYEQQLAEFAGFAAECQEVQP